MGNAAAYSCNSAEIHGTFTIYSSVQKDLFFNSYLSYWSIRGLLRPHSPKLSIEIELTWGRLAGGLAGWLALNEVN